MKTIAISVAIAIVAIAILQRTSLGPTVLATPRIKAGVSSTT